MRAPGQIQITQLLAACHAQDGHARRALWNAVYDELRRMARQQLFDDHHDPAMQTTMLVNEAYLRLVGGGDVAWENRRHFFAAAAEAMRRIRIDAARRRGRAKRGGGRKRVGLDETLATGWADPLDLIAIDEALGTLEAENPRPAEVVKLRFFAGLGVEDTAAALGVSPRTVELDWRYARAWLHKALRGGEPE